MLFSASKDGKSWQPAAVLIDSLSPATEDLGHLMHVHAVRARGADILVGHTPT